MKVSREKAAANRERILDAAGTLFRHRGFAGVGVVDIMRAADLTHGGFYGHFTSKDDLITQASRRSMTRAAVKWNNIVAAAPERPFAALLENYLSPRHRDEPGRGCAFAALGGDTARGGKTVRAEYAKALERLLDILAGSLPAGSKAARRRQAITAMAGFVGALTLARAVGDAALSDEILQAVSRELLAAVES